MHTESLAPRLASNECPINATAATGSYRLSRLSPGLAVVPKAWPLSCLCSSAWRQCPPPHPPASDTEAKKQSGFAWSQEGWE